jgi:hypothetical protein
VLPPSGRGPSRSRTIVHSTSAPAAIRTAVKTPGPIEVPPSASLHSSELPAKASMATAVTRATGLGR